MLITFEGIDGCGKSTQAKLLKEKLDGEHIETLLLREPGGTELSEQVRTLLLNKDYTHPLASETELLLFAASRAQLIHEVIKPALERNAIIILDRFTDSTIAYQSFGRGIPLGFVEEVNRIATDDIEPDLTFLFDIDLPTASKRRENTGKDRIEAETEVFYNRVILGYMYLAQHHTERINVLDATDPIESIQKNIWRLVQEERAYDVGHANHLSEP
jgi:dTMP kinase